MKKTTNNQNLTEKEIEKILNDKQLRKQLAMNSHYYFFAIYFNSYLKYGFADFHHQMFHLTEDVSKKLCLITAFRDSGKSTIISLSYILWSILGTQQNKFVLHCSKTQQQASMVMQNIQRELETNDLLIKDFGLFLSKDNQWSMGTLVLPRTKARITVSSYEQSIRGIRHGENRPSLVILDDIEDTNNVKTFDSRKKIKNWFHSEVQPVGSDDTRFFVVSNYLHDDSLTSKLKSTLINEGQEDSIVWAPIINQNNKSNWPDRYPTVKDIEKKKRTIANNAIWNREYLLKITPDDDQVIRPEWINYYENLSVEKIAKFVYIGIAVDLAISQKTTADKTAIVTFGVEESEHTKIYILNPIINKKMTFPQTLAEIKKVFDDSKRFIDYDPEILVEATGVQASLAQQLHSDGYQSKEVSIGNSDKRERLSLTTTLFEQQRLLFPKNGSKELVNQLLDFGNERYDDLVDAISLALNYALARKLVTDYVESPTPNYGFCKSMFESQIRDYESPSLYKEY